MAIRRSWLRPINKTNPQRLVSLMAVPAAKVMAAHRILDAFNIEQSLFHTGLGFAGDVGYGTELRRVMRASYVRNSDDDIASLWRDCAPLLRSDTALGGALDAIGMSYANGFS